MKVMLFIGCVAAISGMAKGVPPVECMFGYLTNVGVPLADKIREAEDAIDFRITGGSGARLGDFPYQAGLLIKIGVKTAACGGSLVSENRVITAGHCWEDGVNTGNTMTVVLGSVQLFIGGMRIETTNVVTHPKWDPKKIMNDIAIVYLPTEVTFSQEIAPISLPSGSELYEDFTGVTAIVSGFGQTDSSDPITVDQFLSYIEVEVIPNNVCIESFPSYVKDGNICTGIKAGVSTCHGDSGGPMALTRNNRTILIGIVSFGANSGCGNGKPVVFTRTTKYMNFINEHLD